MRAVMAHYVRIRYHICRFAFACIIATFAAGCANFTSEASRLGTQVVLRNGEKVTSELIGVDGDSLIIAPHDGSFRDVGLHYRWIDRVLLLNDGSRTGSVLAGGVLGGF